MDEIIHLAYQEDLAKTGDVTSAACIDAKHKSKANIVYRQPAIICGIKVLRRIVELYAPKVKLQEIKNDSEAVSAGDIAAILRGNTQQILAIERIALNFMQQLSAVASNTFDLKRMISHTRTQLLDTRKTLPGMRVLQKYAVKCGGGQNHRMGLHDMVMIKDNHIAAAGSITAAVRAVQAAHNGKYKIEVECDTLEQVSEAIACGGIDVILADNMAPELLTQVVQMANGKALVEASGGITKDNIKAIAETGVDFISMGALTHSIKAIDIGLDFES